MKLREVIITLYLALMRIYLVPVSSLGLLSERKSLANWKESSAGPPGWLGAAGHSAEKEAEGAWFV